MRFLAIAAFLCFWVSVIFALFAIPPRVPLLFAMVWGAGFVLAAALQLPLSLFVGFQVVLTVLLLMAMRQDRLPESPAEPDDSPGHSRRDPADDTDQNRNAQKNNDRDE